MELSHRFWQTAVQIGSIPHAWGPFTVFGQTGHGPAGCSSYGFPDPSQFAAAKPTHYSSKAQTILGLLASMATHDGYNPTSPATRTHYSTEPMTTCPDFDLLHLLPKRETSCNKLQRYKVENRPHRRPPRIQVLTFTVQRLHS